MKRSKYLSVSFAIAIGAAAGLCSGLPTITQADDTEIYLGAASVSAGIRPNVLFILDTSGSMSGTVSGTGMDRMDNMKVAIKKVLDGTNNINVGLMRFSDPGGPILYPVSYIDEDVSLVSEDPAAADINVRIDQSIDDAEQIDADVDLATSMWVAGPDNGKVSLTSPVLDTVRTNGAPSAGGNSFETQVDVDTDDAEQDIGGGLSVGLGSSDLELAYDGNLQVAGMRFRNVAIPQGATILSAELEFVADESHSATGFTLRIQGEDTDDANTYTLSAGDITSRPTTTAFTDWVDPAPWTANDIYTTPAITAIVQEIINRPGWVPDNEMAFVIQYAPGSATGSNEKRVAYSFNRDSDRAPRLRIEWTTEATNPQNQWVGLRFNNVGIPQGAKITSAHLEFVPTQDDAGDLEVIIGAYDSDNLPEFTNTDFGLTAPPNSVFDLASPMVQSWSPGAWTAGVSEQTSDITDLVQRVVDRSGWCGNNSMGFLMGLKAPNDKHGPRVGYSFDSNPTNAPILRIDYDESTGTGGCIDQWVQRQVQAQNDDAEEVVANGNIDVSSTDLDFDNAKMSGMRFTDIPVTKGQKILEARIVFTADSSQSGATTLRFRGEKAADAAVFIDAPNNISKRIRTTASVDWTAADQTSGAQYTSPDLAAVVQEIVDGAGWLPGNALALIEEYVSGGARREISWDRDKIKAPVLRLKIQGPLATTGAGQRTVRTVLKELVDGLDHNGHTPIVDTLYEAARYYAGAKVLYGAYRGWDRDSTYQPNPNSGNSNPKVRRNTRVSHPGSWGGKKTDITQPPGCTDDDLNNAACTYEKVKGDAQYVSPIESNCQSNFIILLTDGIANHNHSEDAIRSYTGVSSCQGGNGEQACGLELVKWLHDTDQSPVAGDQNVFTYTIGFNFSSKWLADLAAAGGGKFHEASDADELTREITQIFADILNRSTSFAAPTLSVNAFNKLFHRSDVYFSLFKPSAAVRWEGNLKKYQLCSSTDSLNNSNWPKDKSGTPKACTDLGEVLDADADPAVIKDPADPDLGRIRDSAESFWSGVADGSEIKVGGAGLEIPAEANRRVLTYTDTAAPNYSALDNVTHRVASAGGGDQGILKGLTGTKAEREKRTQILFGDLTFASTADDREEVIDWMLGTDVDGLEDVPSLASAGRRFAFQDPLHSSAVAVTFGGTEALPMIKLFVGTNDGGLRAVNASNGVEEWIFYPQATLVRQKELRDNFAGKHIYGIDGTPSVWTNDRDGDGVIEAGSDLNSDGFIDETEGDFVRLIVGMRRGGRNLYAVDVTPATAQSSDYTASAGQQTNDVPPTYMWRIEGGVGGFTSLGQTWARPRIAKVSFGTATAGESYDRTTMILSGGYDDFQDGGFGTGGNGNAIYFVDPFDGSLLFVISGSDHGISNQVVVPGMDYPIPSDVALMDSDGNGTADRIYVGDTGGQMWRIDLGADLDAGSATIKPVVGKLATVSNNTDPADKRKFFYPPDVVRVTDGAFSSGGAYDLVVAVTGNRSHPLAETVQDRIYAFRDEQTTSMSDTDDDNFADSYTTLQGALVDPATTGDLLNVTDVLDFTVAANLTDLESANGWYIDLEGSGEKGLAAPVILDGKIFFTTYLPEKVIDPTKCSIQEGAGKLYAVDVLNGNAVQNWDGVGDDTNLTKSDRTYGLGSGIPSQAVPIFQPEGITLLIGGGGGATSVNPNIALPRVRTYWEQEE